MDFGKAVRTVRAARGLSQKELANAASLDPSYVSLIEAGRRKPTLKMAEELARVLDIPVYLFMLLGSEERDLRGVTPKQASFLGRQILELTLQPKGGGRGGGKSRLNKPSGGVAPKNPRRSARAVPKRRGALQAIPPSR